MFEKMPYSKELFVKMFEIAGHKYNEEAFDSPTWFQDLTWTTSQENEYKEWFIDYLKNNSKARKEIMSIRSNSKKMLLKTFDSFNLMYGFKVNDDGGATVI